ncbi:voltage-dependent calcium channel subunit alpha-2/delta-2-like [Plakobranchus ocellatus]|uniref:Voltage-dependent calcium channel subunit alpha-2/delta-2-like n=1 Tax=Plakobranchus ocellatus TaxID=259542 RepID=A0AAV4AM12_9GAST|nr:voltage-dependent calcium channel subunit alpha-2/delta-2-like [Plakobranchus ocellatus]
MADVGLLHCRRQPALAILITLGIILSKSWSKQMPSQNVIEEWAKRVDSDISNMNHIHTIVEASYEKLLNYQEPGFSMSSKKIDSTTLVAEMAAELSVKLGKKTDALRETVKVAERIAAGYSWKDEIQKDDVGYRNSKELDQKNVHLVFDDRFEKRINNSFSGVHIPVEIFDGNNEILNGLNWTDALDEQFKINARNDPEILWQYFGSQSGFMRTYPATPWPRKKVDLYDVRRQSWYTQGSSSPKDMMILIDKSGSTHGQSLQLMQNAVKSILDTLGENDFVNIVQFAEEASFVSRCFNHTPFVQANYRNKKQLERDVDRLEASGQADFSSALKFAFEKFQEFSANDTGEEKKNIGANCNKVIMLLTDGGTDNAEHIFKMYNWPNKTVRVFTYAVGPTPNPVHAIRWMACANRGYFSPIPAMGAIRARVQKYTTNLVELMGLGRGRHVSCEVTYDPRGLGMMTTVTLPVYNTSIYSSNQTILGVVGIDVTTDQLVEKTPFDKIGPNGYSFAINPNGYVVFHPNLKTSGKYMTEPPNIDILDLEIDEDSPDMEALRTAMIEGNTGDMFIGTRFLSPDQRYVTFNEAEYAYTPIKNSTFSLGLCIPAYKKNYYEFSGNISKLNWNELKDPAFKVLIAPWNYHKNMTKMKDLTGTIDDIIDLLKTDPNADDWNLDLLFHLYWDSKVMNSDFKKFNSSRITRPGSNTSAEDVFEDGNDDLGRESTFVMTSGGLTVVHPASDAAFFESHQDPRKSSLFTRAQHSTSCVLMSDYTEDNTTTSHVTVACGVTLKEKSISVDKPAVAGHRFDHETVLETIYSSIKKVSSSNDLLSCEEGQLACYILDDGGFLVAGNVDEPDRWIGHFIGEVDPVLFKMLDGEVFSKVEQYDFQSTCQKEDSTVNAGFASVRIPSLNLLFEVLSLGWWSKQVSWALTSFSLYSLLTPEVTVFADDDEENDQKCVKAFQQYYIVKDTTTFHTRKENKQNCTRRVTAVKMPKVSSLFVVADPPREECYEPNEEKDLQAPRKVEENEVESIVCAMAQSPRSRKRSYACYHADPREDSSECGCSCLQLSRVTLVLMIISILWQWTTSQK